MSSPLNCLVTGASGYIGGRLVPELLSAGYAVRCMARDPGKLSDRPWSDDVEIAVADAVDESAVRRALEGVDVAYYLIHSLGTDASFEPPGGSCPSTRPSPWPCGTPATVPSPPAGRRPRRPARPATRCRPTRRGPADPCMSTRATASCAPRLRRCGG